MSLKNQSGFTIMEIVVAGFLTTLAVYGSVKFFTHLNLANNRVLASEQIDADLQNFGKQLIQQFNQRTPSATDPTVGYSVTPSTAFGGGANPACPGSGDVTLANPPPCEDLVLTQRVPPAFTQTRTIRYSTVCKNGTNGTNASSAALDPSLTCGANQYPVIQIRTTQPGIAATTDIFPKADGYAASFCVRLLHDCFTPQNQTLAIDANVQYYGSSEDVQLKLKRNYVIKRRILLAPNDRSLGVANDPFY